MKHRARRNLTVLFIAVGLFSTVRTGLPTQTETVVTAGLASVFEPGPILQDRNGDDQVDFVSARLVLPDSPASEDVAAAVAVAARLGLETSGLSFPLAFRASEISDLYEEGPPLIIIGTGNVLLPEVIANRVSEFEPGEGTVTFSNGKVFIAGKDPAGTQAAGEAFAARSPYLWNIIGRDQGDTYQKIASDLAGFLGEKGVLVSSVSFDELIYRQKGREAETATVTASVPLGTVTQARDFLSVLASDHRKGQGTDRLNYASVSQIIFRVTDGQVSDAVTVSRVGLPARYVNPPRREPSRFRGQGASAADGGRGRQTERTFDLSALFSAEGGLLQDEDGDQIPDDSDMMIVFPHQNDVGGDYPALGVTQLGARIGLESTGLSFPLLGFDKELDDPEGEGRPLVLIGRHNRLVQELASMGKLREAEPVPGVGRVEMVPSAYHQNSAVVLIGGDLEGEEAAAEYLSRRAPYVWEIGNDEPTLKNAKDSVRKLLAGRTSAAQAALALDELEQILEEISEKELESISIDAYFEEASPDFDDWATRELSRRFGTTQIEVSSQGRMDSVQVFQQKPELEWEVDAFWKKFREEVLSEIASGAKVSMELRVSEAPELRRELAIQVKSEIEAQGGEVEEVIVLSAYKQGLLWLMEQVAPVLENLPVATVELGWKPFPVEIPTDQRFQGEPARWLNELYPADDLLAGQLGLPLNSVSFFMQEEGESIYSVTAKDSSGVVLLQDSFSPKYYERPYFDAFPDYAQVTVTTGWLKATVDEVTLVDERIATDSDRIWDYYQATTLEEVYDEIKSNTGGKPTRDKAPYFHTLRVELKASEPDYKLEIDQEHISVLESLHDDIYFDTLDFFYEVAETAAGGDAPRSRSLAPGNVLPWIHPERRGQPPELTITYSGFASKQPKLVVRYREKENEEYETETRVLAPAEIPEPYIYLAEVKAGEDGLARLGFLVTLEDTEPLPRIATLLDNLQRLQDEGLFTEALGIRGAAQIVVRLEAPGAVSTRTYASQPAERSAAPSELYRSRLVTWDHVISPAESEIISHTLGTLPNVTTYVGGYSYQGRPVSVMEIKLPMEAELVSQAKLNTWKPVLSIVGRQHANEVSSTSHILRLAELMATDPQYQSYLKRMNVVIQPVVNPDGASLSYELQKLTPTHCLHAGRYSALGPDVPGQVNNPDTLLTEALVMRDVSRKWVADVRLNPHGYPSHEWVHQFANYNPKSFRSYWIPRGWYTSASVIEDPRLKDYNDAALAMRDYIAEEVSKDPQVRETNLRIYDRYQRWTMRWQPHLYNLEIYRDTAIYHSRRNSSVSVPGPEALIRPTVFSGSTEAMDETAQGPWLDLVTRMGFGYLMASVRFLDEAVYSLYRMEGESQGSVRISLTRPRPIRSGRPGSGNQQ